MTLPIPFVAFHLRVRLQGLKSEFCLLPQWISLDPLPSMCSFAMRLDLRRGGVDTTPGDSWRPDLFAVQFWEDDDPTGTRGSPR